MSLSSLFIRNIIAPLWAAKEGTPYLQHLQQLNGAKYRKRQLVQTDQWQLLSKLLVHAYENTSFYRLIFDMDQFRPENIKKTSDFLNFPILTKDKIRSNSEQMIARNYQKNQLIPRKTSGSTGVSLEFFVDEESSQWKRAVTMTYDRWAGWDIGERVGAIWGNPDNKLNWRLYLRNLLLTRYDYLDTLKMDEKEMSRFHQTLCKKPPAILFGHAHSLFLFARFMQSKGLSGIKPRGIISTCMVLHDFERQAIEEVFGCRVTNRYGCEEVSLIACECPEGNMHLNCDTLLVEFIRDGKPVPPGEPGAIVVTDLTNYGMPFIRYKVGDVGVPSTKTSCHCGCTYPIMDSLEGRVADYVVTPDGNYISGISLTENFAMHLPGVKQMQIVQEEIDYLIFRIVKGECFSEQTESDINRLALERFGDRMRHTIEYTESIQSESSGKYRFCISKIPNQFC
ncbi:MAG: phenylacetate--CoA ligase family protein [Geobacteraceae bacterium]|nr:phenylacetate--CoA ligase family protein [Geobacteraceae bacterium]NTW80789.1 phenylacetate--CoA ligase family protein [Geobacteraceae bacterium]